jgi:hypothetical protein
MNLLTPAPKGKISVSASALDSTDAKPFAESIRKVLEKSGFEISDPPKHFAATLSWDRPGAWMIVSDLHHAPPHARPIQNAFGSLGIYLEGIAKPDDVDADAVVIGVSSHPLKSEPVPPELLGTPR